MSFSTGVKERDAMIVRVIQEATACRDPISVESLAALLPPDFELDQVELDGILSNMPPEPTTVQDAEPQMTGIAHHGKPMIDRLPDGRPFKSAPETLEKIEAPDLPGGTYTITDRNKARVIPKIAEAEARRALDVANARLTKARDQMAVAKGVLKERRNDLASAVMAWQLLDNGINNANDSVARSDRQQREIRNHLAAQAAERAARVGRRPDTAKMFVQRHMRNGPSRGAFDRSAAARSGYINRDPNRGAVPKLPSER